MSGSETSKAGARAWGYRCRYQPKDSQKTVCLFFLFCNCIAYIMSQCSHWTYKHA